MEKHIYSEVLKRGIPHANHYSDLYIPVTQETAQLLEAYDLRATTFVNQVEGGVWYDVPFQYLPYWEEKAKDNISEDDLEIESETNARNRLALGTRERDDQEKYFGEGQESEQEDDNG